LISTVYGTGIHRVCAWGRDAQQHSKGYEYLLDIDGWVLLLLICQKKSDPR
jgi:hypothetical protein